MDRLSLHIKYLIFLVIAGLAGCTPPHPQLNGSHRIFDPLLSVELRPRFILSIEPEENSVTALRQYRDEEYFNNSICIEPNFRYIAQAGDSLLNNEVPMRSNLLVDDQEVPLDSIVEMTVLTILEIDGQEAQIPGPTTLCWKTQVSPGLHLAHLTIKQTDGNILSYRWHFIISK